MLSTVGGIATTSLEDWMSVIFAPCWTATWTPSSSRFMTRIMLLYNTFEPRIFCAERYKRLLSCKAEVKKPVSWPWRKLRPKYFIT